MKTCLPALPLLMGIFSLAAVPSTERIGIENDYAKINATAEKDSKTALRPAAEITPRDGLPNLFARLDRGEPVTIAFFGGSITASRGWRTHTLEWFRKNWPEAEITEVNASVGGTGSIIGAFRADDDLIAFNPDAVFIEFSLNDVRDAAGRPDEVAGALEGIIRKLRMNKPDTDICLAYTLHSAAVDLLNEGKFSASVSVHESIAEHYGIPSIHMGVEAARMAAEDQLVFTAPKSPGDKDDRGRIVFTNDGTHPTPGGHLLYGRAAIRGLESLRQQTAPKPHLLPPSLSAIPWEKAKTLPAGGYATFSGTWEKLTADTGPACRRFGTGFYAWFPHLFRTSTPDSSVTVRFRGTHIGFKGMQGPDSGVISIRINDRPPRPQSLFTIYANQWAYVGSPVSVPRGDHTITWTLLDEVPDKESLLAKRNVDQDFRDHPEKYKDNTLSLGQIIVLGDILDENGQLLP
jgi:hypothetical protein